MSIGRFLARLRSNIQPNAIIWKHSIKNLGKPSRDLESVRRSEQEQAQVESAIKGVFYANLSNFSTHPDSEKLPDVMELDYNHNHVNDMFVRGIISEIVERNPPLPTEPFDRVNIHLLAHFMHANEITLDEARVKVHRTVDLYNEASELFEMVISMGRAAYRTSDCDLLIRCHKEARLNPTSCGFGSQPTPDRRLKRPGVATTSSRPRELRIEPAFTMNIPQQEAPTSKLNPKFTGDFLIHQWLLSEDSKFGISAGEIDNAMEGLPDEVKQHFPLCVHLYLAWLMRGMAGNKYGREFQIDMMAHAFARLENSGLTDAHVPVDVLRAYFGAMDDALKIYSDSNDKDPVAALIPFHLFAATRLLQITDGGIFKDDKDAFGNAMLSLGEALEAIDTKARPFLNAAVERSAESREAFE